MGWARAALVLLAVVAAGALLISGGSGADPETPAALPGLPPPFLGTTVVGSGGATAAIDAYGDVVDLRASPGGRALIDNSSARQAAGTVSSGTGIVPWVSIDGGPARPLWTADSVTQRYLPGTNAVRTTARFGPQRVAILFAATDGLACLTRVSPGARIWLRSSEPAARGRLQCDDRAARLTIRTAEREDRRWLQRARPLGASAPPWAQRLYDRSLLTLRALTDPRTGASVAGARDNWSYVWPRDAATAAMALDAAGYRSQARRISHFLSRLDVDAAARFYANGQPVLSRGPQGDAAGWVSVAKAASRRVRGGLAGPSPQLSAETSPDSPPPSALPDYQEGPAGNYLGNAIASGASASEIEERFDAPRGLVRKAEDPGSGLDSAAAWAVEPFPIPSLRPQVQKTLIRLAAHGNRFGITPGEAWPGTDPWTAPTAWSAWSLAALGDRRAALRLLGDLRRAATPAGALPERVDAQSGIPRSTTPLAWSHALAILALRTLWPTSGAG
jgi:hypothetical protein